MSRSDDVDETSASAAEIGAVVRSALARPIGRYTDEHRHFVAGCYWCAICRRRIGPESYTDGRGYYWHWEKDEKHTVVMVRPWEPCPDKVAQL